MMFMGATWHPEHTEVVVQELTRLFAVAISAFRMSGSYLEDEEDLELTAGDKEMFERGVNLGEHWVSSNKSKKTCKSVELTACLRRGLVSPGIIQLPVLLLRKQEALLLHLVDLLLGTEGVAGHRQVVAQHRLLLTLPLGPRVLQLGALWEQAVPFITLPTVSWPPSGPL